MARQKPERDEWGSGVEALECSLQLEKNVNQSLLDLHKVASDHNDPHVSALLIWSVSFETIKLLNDQIRTFLFFLHSLFTKEEHVDSFSSLSLFSVGFY